MTSAKFSPEVVDVGSVVWRDEIAYCTRLVETGGNREVPRRQVENYLNVQLTAALLDGNLDDYDGRAAATLLNALRIRWVELQHDI